MTVGETINFLKTEFCWEDKDINECEIFLDKNCEECEIAVATKALEFESSVVRCKECEHFREYFLNSTNQLVHICEYARWLVGENGYCLYGERKEE